ncbi:DUF2971 domain-containing protein [Sinorhizobium meliloti]|uniref:Uncharacterized protein n=1 Tax=Sinorhizobium meliloti (strain SM11) TaxID=707241 RepID=A4KVN2_SINMM|nr:DUF2971 domain-containing protein [Sinorhizobium meliloti]ABN47133.1 hypothetical protein [Sinorhizobium meliloti SM11]MDE4561781.1 DUF2971 domain-containing protein [Sinorhizobium meliloti SM11]WQP09467.1 DUF2971 domain-containing protein [Sinorhizobium meliloti]WQP36321.1 DUF2971 domain-containing protein [Sinorhizobium meliloti]
METNISSQREAIEAILQDHSTLLDSNCSLEQCIEANDPDLQSFIAALLTLVPLLKHPGFSEEAEWRVVRGPFEAEAHCTEFRTSRDTVIPFQRIDLVTQNDPSPFAELTIGPSPDARDRTFGAIRRLLDQHGLQSCDLRVSDIPYRGW